MVPSLSSENRCGSVEAPLVETGHILRQCNPQVAMYTLKTWSWGDRVESVHISDNAIHSTIPVVYQTRRNGKIKNSRDGGIKASRNRLYVGNGPRERKSRKF